MAWLISRALIDSYESSRSSLGQEVESSEESYLAGAQSAPSSSTHTPQAYLSLARMTAFSRLSRYGMTFAPLTDDRGEDVLTWYREASPVRTSQSSSETQQVLLAHEAGSGLKWRASSESVNLDLFSSKTRQPSSGEASTALSETLPRWGMFRGGQLLEPTTQVLPTIENDSGWWATPAARDWKDTPGMSKKREKGKHRIDMLPRQVYASLDGSESFTPPTATTKETALDVELIFQIAGVPAPQWKSVNTVRSMESSGQGPKSALLNPAWVEWLMGWPPGWTDFAPLGMDRFRQWLRLHGVSCDE